MTKEAFFNTFGYYPFQNPSQKHHKQARTKKLASTNTNTRIKAKDYVQLKYEQMSEEDHQAEFIKWLDLNKIYFEIGLEGIFLPNPHTKGSKAFAIQSASNRKVLAKMKAQGLRKGSADIKVYLPKVVLHIELKSMKGKASDEQKKVSEVINKLEYANYEIIKGSKQAIAYVEKYMKNE